jgi:hypothetical protein
MNPVFEEVAVDKSLRHHCVSEDLGSVACAKTVVASYRPRSQREHFSEKRQYVHGTGSANRLAFPRVIHPGHQDQIACVPAPVSSAVQSHHRSLSWAVPQEGDAVMILDHSSSCACRGAELRSGAGDRHETRPYEILEPLGAGGMGQVCNTTILRSSGKMGHIYFALTLADWLIFGLISSCI